MASELLPEVRRGDVDLALVSELSANDPHVQRKLADAALARRQKGHWPVGLLSDSWLLGVDGKSVLRYAQWSGAAAHDIVDRSRAYRLHRSVVTGSGETGCVVVVSFEIENIRRGKEWIDALIAAGDGVEPTPGMLSAHFHVSTDGSRVINYAEWTAAAAHEDAVGGRAAKVAASAPDSAVAHVVDKTPGVRCLGYARYLPYRGVVRP